jgi:hypothetical protein
LIEAQRIATSYSTAVTLRQLHYRLVASGTGHYINSDSCYQILSKHTSRLRRQGQFPTLVDTTRGVRRPTCFTDPAQALVWLARIYQRPRSEGQQFQTWVIYEKATLGAQIEAWTEEYGIPTAALRGYSSESLEREVFDDLATDGRGVAAFYVGDLDPEGEDIERNFLAQADAAGVTFKLWERLAVLPAQIAGLSLVPNPGKSTSTRAPKFTAKYGQLFQIEAEAVDPAVLEQLVTDAVRDEVLFEVEPWEESKAQEARDREWLEGRQP